MALKIPETVIDRALNPGQAQGEPNVTQAFGNRVEQAAFLPSAPSGLGGVANPAAGAESQAWERAAQTIQQSATDATNYYQNLRTAEEDGRARLMLLGIDKSTNQLRTKLDQDPFYTSLSTTEQQQQFEMQRDAQIDDARASAGLSDKKIIQQTDVHLAEYRSRSSTEYMDKVVRPRIVEQSKVNDVKSDSLLIDTVTAAPTPENVAKATANLNERYDSPQAFATYGAAGVFKMKNDAIAKLAHTVQASQLDQVERSALATLPGISGPITNENLKTGAVAALALDQLNIVKAAYAQLPISDSVKLDLATKAEKYINQFTQKRAADHNIQLKEAEKTRLDAVQDSVDTFQVQNSILARDGKLTKAQAFTAFSKLSEQTGLKGDPQALKKLYMAYDKVDNEIEQRIRDQKRLASEAATRNSLAQHRIDNGIAVSAGAVEAIWKKNGTLKSFIDGGNVLTPSLVAQIDKAGAVPTSVMGSIESDSRSQDATTRKRGIENMLKLESFSSKAQAALYKDLPDDYAGVINRLKAGQNYDQALQFLSRPKNTPDVEKKLQQEARSHKVSEVGESVMSEMKFDPKNMASSLKDVLLNQWGDAYARSGGDQKLAQDLFKQDLAKNKKIKVSDFSGKVELHPTSFYAPKDVVSEIIHQDFPETKGKDIMPVYGGMITTQQGGKTVTVPTYDIYMKNEAGLNVRINTDQRGFVLTPDSVNAVVSKRNDDKLKGLTDKAIEEKENARYFEGGNARLIERKNKADEAVRARKAKETN